MTDQEILKNLTKSELQEYWIDYRNLIRELRAELKEVMEKYSRQQIQAFADSLRWWGVAITPTLMAKYIEAFLNKQAKKEG